jgi:hypothetical protein
MARLSPLLLALFLGAAAAVALVSCGGGDADLLPGTTADQIESNLDQVEELAEGGDCIGAEDAVAEVAAEVEELEGVDLKLKAALQEGTGRLSEVVSGCEEETTSSEETEPSFESDVGAEEVEDEKKPKKVKPEKEEEEPKEEPSEEEDEGSELPPQSNGEGEEKGKGEPPAEPEAEETPPSGGVGPGVGVE